MDKFTAVRMGRRSFLAVSVGALGSGLLGCVPRQPESASDSQKNSQAEKNQSGAGSGQLGKMTLSSPAFTVGGTIPAKYTCDGENLSPDLSWDAPPSGTKSLAMLVSDPDAPTKTFVHWVLFDLPPDLRQLPEGVPANPLLSEGGTHGKSDFGKFGYGGPCPPRGASPEPHRYVFRLYALDKLLDLPPGASPAEVLNAMEGHTLAEAELVGRYRRP